MFDKRTFNLIKALDLSSRRKRICTLATHTFMVESLSHRLGYGYSIFPPETCLQRLSSLPYSDLGWVPVFVDSTIAYE